MTNNETIQDGGPAFPGERIVWDAPNHPSREIDRIPVSGMSLRDYFAGQALAGLMFMESENTFIHDATNCYKMADAMIKARMES